MPTTVRKWNYGDYKSDNYGAHSLAVQVGSLTLYFSYDTVIAFSTPVMGLVVSENVWSVTTGKHLNWIQPNKEHRVNNSSFDTALEEVLKGYTLAVS